MSDSVVSKTIDLGKSTKTGNHPKTFIISKFAAIACAGDALLCLETVKIICKNLKSDAVFSDIAPLVQRSYIKAAQKVGFQRVELILAAKTRPPHKKAKLIKYVMKKNNLGLKRVENKDHYTAGKHLPLLEKDMCTLLTTNYIRTGGIEENLQELILKASNVINSPKSLPLGICFSALMPVIKDYVEENKMTNEIGSPWTILLLPEDGEIHFETTEMYDESKSISPNKIDGVE